jgi:hypothetical protein
MPQEVSAVFSAKLALDAQVFDGASKAPNASTGV